MTAHPTLQWSLSVTAHPILPELVTLVALFISMQLSIDTVVVQELCESRGGRPGLSVLTSLLVSVDVKNY